MQSATTQRPLGGVARALAEHGRSGGARRAAADRGLDPARAHPRRSGNLLSPSLSSSDVAQEAVLNLFKVQEPPSFDQPAALRAYLWTSAWRLLHAHLQRAGRSLPLDPSASHPNASQRLDRTSGGLRAVDERDRSVALELARALLEPDDQAILGLVYFQQQTVESAASRLGITNEAAKKRVAARASALGGEARPLERPHRLSARSRALRTTRRMPSEGSGAVRACPRAPSA
jgi:RNA polymerase sigma factor (sigma-70 family)